MVWFRSSAPDWPYYTQCSTIPQIPLAKGSERVSGWRREMASNHRYPALRQVLYPAKLSLHDGGSSPPNSVTQTGSRRTESRRVPGAEECSYVCMLLRHSSAAARAAVRHPPRGGRLNGWHAVRQMLCIASYHVISIHPTDSVWSWKSDLNR